MCERTVFSNPIGGLHSHTHANHLNKLGFDVIYYLPITCLLDWLSGDRHASILDTHMHEPIHKMFVNSVCAASGRIRRSMREFRFEFYIVYSMRISNKRAINNTPTRKKQPQLNYPKTARRPRQITLSLTRAQKTATQKKQAP